MQNLIEMVRIASLGRPNHVRTTFNRRMTLSNQGGMVVATAYRLGKDFNASALSTLVPPDPPRVSCIDINLFHCIYETPSDKTRGKME